MSYLEIFYFVCLIVVMSVYLICKYSTINRRRKLAIEEKRNKLQECWQQERDEDLEKYVRGEMSYEEVSSRIKTRPQAWDHLDEAEKVYGHLI